MNTNINGEQRRGLPVGRMTIDVRRLQPSPENKDLYRERSTDDADFRRLVESVRKLKVRVELVVSRDQFIISGHQRRRAALRTRQFEVPVEVLDVWRDDCTDDQWIALLREYNTGREKTFDEKVREKLVDINPDDAMQEVVIDRFKRSRARVNHIEIDEARMKRYRISEEKRGMADAVLLILLKLEAYLPVSLRAIHYRMLNQPIYRNTATKLLYRNDVNSYKDLSDLVTRMRLAGKISWETVCDDTRPEIGWLCWKNGADFVADECHEFLTGYARDLLQSQPMFLAIVAEKLTVQNFIEPVAGKYTMPGAILRGNSAIVTRYRLAEKFRRSGKDKLFLFCMGDCDPDGDSIVQTTLKSFRDDFGISNVNGTRVAMTHEQADRLSLPHTLDAKPTSSNFKKFVAKHRRDDAYELEAVEPTVLQDWLDKSIRAVLDMEAFNFELLRQAADAADILAKRRAVLEIMKRSPD